ncbi:hypothetical protein BN946_scf185007.g137 [Trametes cinnabarina]|uniref:Uncharacterized protein n=1 Tax=Pycnoporus cinnabarinus TaxID=5643 RepID=A0A060SKV8_PYCCI|nr:hypothetical protein BN946_scf185007.g137 [Trametes cinnabarina]
MDTVGRELELRAHIRSLLSQYALTHLATDHLAWTEDTVANTLAACLHTIPATDSTAVALPVDPFDWLNRHWHLSMLDLYDEKWRVPDKQALEYLKQQMNSKAIRTSNADREWAIDDDGEAMNTIRSIDMLSWRSGDFADFFDAFMMRRPMSPILSARAIRETPALGQGRYSEKVPQSNKQMLQSFSIGTVKNVVLNEPNISTDDVLANKIPMDARTHREVVALVNTVPFFTKRSQDGPPHFIAEFLRADSPPPDLPELEALPMFPRRGRSLHDRDSELAGLEEADPFSIPRTMSHLATSVLSSVVMREEDEEDLAEEHLVVVNGWQAFRSSSPPSAGTPSLGGSSSEVDELFMPSSPHSELFEANQLYMEEYEMPRLKRPGGHFDRRLPPQDKLSDFLPSLMRTASSCRPRIMASPKSQPSSPRTTLTAAMLGQPPSPAPAINLQYDPTCGPSSDDTIAFALNTVEKACENCLQNGDPGEVILSEKLDEKDGLLMDVPRMCPPNEHTPSDMFLPTGLTELLVPPKTHQRHSTADRANASEANPVIACLKKAKGLQPLQIELSWIPFKYGRTMPTDEEAADVQNDPCPQLAKRIDMAPDEIVTKLGALLDDSMAFSSQPTKPEVTPSTIAWSSHEGGEDLPLTSYTFEAERVLVLTRNDRQRLSGLPVLSSAYIDVEEAGGHLTAYAPSEDENEECRSEALQPERCRPAKRVRFTETIADDICLVPPILPTMPGAAEIPGLDDSGVFLEQEHSAYSDQSRPGFGHLAYEAEVLDEMDTLSEIFPDVHGVHFGDYSFDDSLERCLTDVSRYQQAGFVVTPLSLSSSSYVSPVRTGSLEAAEPPYDHSPAHDRRPLFSPSTAPARAPNEATCMLSQRHIPSPGYAPHVNTDDRHLVIVRSNASTARASLVQFMTLCGKAVPSALDDAILCSSPVHELPTSTHDGPVDQLPSNIAPRNELSLAFYLPMPQSNWLNEKALAPVRI